MDNVASEVVARNLGKEFLLNVADDLTVLPDGLKLRVRGRGRAVHVRMIDFDKFTVDSAWPPLYGFQLRPAVESIVGKFDDIHAEVLEIFREAEENARHESAWHCLFMRKIHAHRGRREFTEQARKATEGSACACGCGLPLPYTSNPSRRRFATSACIRSAYAVKRSAKAAEIREVLAEKPCACGCGQSIPRTGRWWRKKYLSRSHMVHALYMADKDAHHRRYLERKNRGKAT